jgi:hypothetical protein
MPSAELRMRKNGMVAKQTKLNKEIRDIGKGLDFVEEHFTLASEGRTRDGAGIFPRVSPHFSCNDYAVHVPPACWRTTSYYTFIGQGLIVNRCTARLSQLVRMSDNLLNSGSLLLPTAMATGLASVTSNVCPDFLLSFTYTFFFFLRLHALPCSKRTLVARVKVGPVRRRINTRCDFNFRWYLSNSLRS